MVTTTQLNEDVKEKLGKFKEAQGQTYEQIILQLMKLVEEYKRNQEKLMIGGCKEMAEESLKITKEFETIEDLKDWEWNENGD